MKYLEQTLQFLHLHRTIVFVVLTLFVFVLGYLNFNHAEAPEITESLPQNDITISLSVADRYTNSEFTANEGDVVLDALESLDVIDPEMQLTTEYYEGLGMLVTGMYGLENGADGNYWQYEVNGVMPQIGAGAYALTASDTVQWNFTESQY